MFTCQLKNTEIREEKNANLYNRALTKCISYKIQIFIIQTFKPRKRKTIYRLCYNINF